MHIHLIGNLSPKSPDGCLRFFPWGLAWVAAQLERTKHSFDVTDTHLDSLAEKDLAEICGTLTPGEVFGISAYTEGYSSTKRLASAIKQLFPDSIVIVGGLLARSFSELLKDSDVDIAVVAPDGDIILPMLLDALETGSELDSVPGIVVRRGAELVQTPRFPIISKEEFLKSPSPSFQSFSILAKRLADSINANTTNLPVKAFPLLLSRGCPFECTFCGHSYGRIFRRPSWDSIFDQMAYLVKHFDVQGFFSLDTNLFFNRHDVDQFCEMYVRRGCDFKMIAELRASFGDQTMFQKLADHGVRVALFGFESGSQQILDTMRKRTKIEHYYQIASEATKTELVISGFFLFGMPGESRRTIWETRRFLLYLRKCYARQKRIFKERGTPYPCTSAYTFSILVPLPESEVFDRLCMLGYIKDLDSYFRQLALKDNSWRTLNFRNYLSGGPINLSDFRSRLELVAYVNLTMAYVDWIALYYEAANGFSLSTLVKRTARVAANLFKYGFRHIETLWRRDAICLTAQQKHELRQMLRTNTPSIKSKE